MTNLELDHWKRTRAAGRGRFILKALGRRALWFSIPVAVTFYVASWHDDKSGGFWSKYQFLMGAFAVVTVLVGLGDGMFVWMTHEREYSRQVRFLDPKPPTTAAILRERKDLALCLRGYIESEEESFSEDSLVHEARALAEAHARGFLDIDAACAKFSPILKMSMSAEVFQLAARAGVCEEAAFLALMGQCDN